MHHARVSSIEFIPFFVLTYLLTIERKSLLFLLLTIILYAINALFCWYYLFYIGYFIAFHTFYVVIRDRALPRGSQLLAPVACLVGVVLALSPILVPMVRAAIGKRFNLLAGWRHLRSRRYCLSCVSAISSSRVISRWRLSTTDWK